MIAWETGEAGRKRQEKAARDLHRRRRSTTPSRLLGIAGVLFVSGVAVLNIVTIFQFRDNALRSASHVGETMGQAMPSAQMHAAALEQAASARPDTVALNATFARAVSWPELGRLVIGAYLAVGCVFVSAIASRRAKEMSAICGASSMISNRLSSL